MSPGYTPELCPVALCLRRQIRQDSIDFGKHFLLLASIDRFHIAYPKTHLNRHMALPLHPFYKAETLKDFETTRLNAVCLAFDDFFWALVDYAAFDAVARCPYRRHQTN